MRKPENEGWARAKRFGRWMALTACLAGCGAAQGHRGTITLGGGRGVPVIILDRNQSDVSIVNMRNYISALNRILERLVCRTVDMTRINGEPPFEGALGLVQVARTSQEVAGEFVEKCNSALTSDEVSPEGIESIMDRYAFAHGLLRDAILKFRDRFDPVANVGGIPASLGYPQIDLFGDF
ncbi:MAG TPA: hypothetical protein PKJ97_02005 [Candidatus Bilamarchaeaceae archaeon]|nr:hypothetical protein [Candidatus Bilamarchaeaceae archaeon]